MPPKKSKTSSSTSTNPDILRLLQALQQQTNAIAQQQIALQQQLNQQHQNQQHQDQQNHDQQQDQDQNRQEPPNPPQPVVSFKTFQSVKPPEFHDTTDPVVANTWIKEMEKAFELVQLGEDQKTVYASYFLKGDVIFWWETVQALEGNRIVTWNRFKELFLEKYFPKYMQTQMELKFLELKQGNMSVLEYEKKFTELSRFVNKYVHTDEEKAQRF